jgi:hypothetical protein
MEVSNNDQFNHHPNHRLYMDTLKQIPKYSIIVTINQFRISSISSILISNDVII